MSIDTLIFRLSGLKETLNGQYIALCPGHDDRSPSLSVRECEDGRVLLHCFAGCDTGNVLAAIGMTFADVMPKRIGQFHSHKPVPFRIPPRDALITLDHESLVVAIIASDFLEHREIDQATWARLAQAVSRINKTRAASAPAKVAR
jgi:hypothetical protein